MFVEAFLSAFVSKIIQNMVFFFSVNDYVFLKAEGVTTKIFSVDFVVLYVSLEDEE